MITGIFICKMSKEIETFSPWDGQKSIPGTWNYLLINGRLTCVSATLDASDGEKGKQNVNWPIPWQWIAAFLKV